MFWSDILRLHIFRHRIFSFVKKINYPYFFPLILLLFFLFFPSILLADHFSANFQDTDLRAFIDTVGVNLNKTMIMGPHIQGRVSIRSTDTLSTEQYYQLFLNVLEAQGYAAIPVDGGALKIVRSMHVKTEPITVITHQKNPYFGDEMMTQVMSLQNISARELTPVLRQLIDRGESGNIISHGPSNILILSGRAAVIKRLFSIIELIDSNADKFNEVIPLKNASATEMVRVINALNKNAPQNDLSISKYTVVADKRTNSVIIHAEPKMRQKIKKLIQELDSETQQSGYSQVFYLKYSQAEDLVDIIEKVSNTLKGKQNEQGQDQNRMSVSIAASKKTNALVVTASQDVMQSIRSIIEQLDIRRAQVHVEALIVEVAEISDINFGVQWQANNSLIQFNNGHQIPLGALTLARRHAESKTGNTLNQNETFLPSQVSSDISLLSKLLSGFSGAKVGIIKGDWQALVQAVKNDSSVNVLSTPSITTLDNQEASFMVGEDVPVLTGSAANANNTNPFNTVERRKIGVMLKVTPQINEGNTVQLLIEQEVSKIQGETKLDIKFAERKLKTTVLADDGQLIVLGGLLDEESGESVSKVPVLGDIPILGHLFKSTVNKKTKRNLMIFIRPTILRDGLSADGISQRKYHYMRAEQLYKNHPGLSLMPRTKQPLLPADGKESEYPAEIRALLAITKKS